MVDTNVLVVANDPNHPVGESCHGACVRELAGVRERRSLLLDPDWGILGEYAARMNRPGLGAEFFKLAAQGSISTPIRITPDEGRGFVEFPKDPRLEGFDRSDRKFVAVAIAHGAETSEILNAADHDWTEFREALVRHGVRVRELCPEYLARKRT